MTIKIDKNVPRPVGRNTGTNQYPFEGMQVDDSFFVEGKTRTQMDNACGHWRKIKGWKFTVDGNRTEIVKNEDGTEREAVGARVWRNE